MAGALSCPQRASPPRRAPATLSHRFPARGTAAGQLGFFGLCIAVSVAAFEGALPESWFDALVADGLAPVGFFGHVVLHLAGNMVFLWVFGNAVCGMVGNVTYLICVSALRRAGRRDPQLRHGRSAGFASGLPLGVLMLSLKWIMLTAWDNPTLVEILRNRWRSP